MKLIKILLSLIIILNTSCYAEENNRNTKVPPNKKESETKEIIVGAERVTEYISLLKNKNVALVVNQTSRTKEKHIVDLLIEEKININTIFSPEHGFRGKADAGEKVKNGKDSKTGISIISLYGKNKKPSPENLKGIDIVIFDIQDVGARFYTYISTLHYVMEACAENNIKLLVLDRPNPNGNYVDGNVLDMDFSSFVGMHPIPIVHGMTIAEYAKMINGEKWLKNGINCDLEYILCENYNRNMTYDLPIKPSPNLPNSKSINLYPSICFFEGTQISVGRGTDFPFQVIGSPKTKDLNAIFKFTPKSTVGAKYPKHKNKNCFGYDLRNAKTLKTIDLSFLINMYNSYSDKNHFFLENDFIDLLAGTDKLRKDIIAGKSEEEIKTGWQIGLNEFKRTRAKYLLYQKK